MRFVELFLVVLFGILSTFFWCSGQEQLGAKYGVRAVSTVEDYKRTCQQDTNQCLVALKDIIPEVVLDIKYASEQNFMKKKMYSRAGAYLRLPAARALRAVQQELNARGLGLKVFDAYRPYRVTVAFYEQTKDTVYVASPRKGSRHNRGCAVDLTLIDLKSGSELAMPTSFDAFTPQAHADYPDLPKEIRENRALLKAVMTKHGFRVYPEEWWHFDYKNWSDFELLDIAFDDL
ncbi:M15 family metallopeptidase [Olivibacter sp. SDN3]|uniref:M15 family metallopeptidase n=1 Tax=Olivibacter sp. SDN3 TaxID=2764720 RepID=UPI0016511300|nr:M15 family metallopeptidase [Olivibacter sp. SDN3]QNL51252.1 M15 family metallopeptidase [Olivibacter sp. SDN3]